MQRKIRVEKRVADLEEIKDPATKKKILGELRKAK